MRDEQTRAADREARELARRLGVDPPDDDADRYFDPLRDTFAGRVIEAGEPVAPPATPWRW